MFRRVELPAISSATIWRGQSAPCTSSRTPLPHRIPFDLPQRFCGQLYEILPGTTEWAGSGSVWPEGSDLPQLPYRPGLPELTQLPDDQLVSVHPDRIFGCGFFPQLVKQCQQVLTNGFAVGEGFQISLFPKESPVKTGPIGTGSRSGLRCGWLQQYV